MARISGLVNRHICSMDGHPIGVVLEADTEDYAYIRLYSHTYRGEDLHKVSSAIHSVEEYDIVFDEKGRLVYNNWKPAMPKELPPKSRYDILIESLS